LNSLIRKKLEVIQRELDKYNLDALVLGKEFTKYVFPEVYDEVLGPVAKFVVMDLSTLDVIAICSPMQVPTIQDVYPQVRVFVVDPYDRVDLGVPRFSDDARALRNALSGCNKVGYAGTVPIDKLRDLELLGVETVIRKIIMRKLDEEIDRIRRSVELTEKAVEEVVNELTVGIREIDIAVLLHEKLVEHGCSGLAFPPIVAIGKNSREPHHIPTAAKFDGHQPILIDVGARVEGYCSDITRIVIPSKLHGEYQNIEDVVSAVEASIGSALSVLRAGVRGNDVYAEALKELERRGYGGLFIHGLGHGIGIDVHEEPYLNQRWEYPIPEGCVVTVEPGVYMKLFGVRIEEDVIVREGGVEQISKLPRIIRL